MRRTVKQIEAFAKSVQVGQIIHICLFVDYFVIDTKMNENNENENKNSRVMMVFL